MSGEETRKNQPEDAPDSESEGPTWISQQIEFTRKELRETLRDRRTIITLMVMPLLLYPLLGFGLRFVALQQSDESEIQYRIAIETDAEVAWLSKAMQAGGRELDASLTPGEEPDIQVLLPQPGAEFDLESMVSESAADMGIVVVLSEPSATGSAPVAKVQIYENEGSSQSRDAALYVERRLAAANIQWVKSWAQRNGQDLAIPVNQSRKLIKPVEQGSAILGLLPLVLLLMTVTGGVYPAIDLTAGERERNTMETLMALPVPRFRLLAAKYVAVVTVTLLTGLMNLLAMGVTLYALQLDKSLLGEAGFTIGLAGKLFLALAAFALFYSAVLLLLTSSARSFKEAQAYLIPLLLLSIVPGFVMFLPGWNLEGGTAVIPLVNILLLSRDLLEGTVQQLPAIVAIVSTVLYGVSALSMAAQVFGNDAVAVGSRGRWSDLLQRPTSDSSWPSLTTVFSTLAILFPVYFIISGVLSRGEADPSRRIMLSAVTTAALFVGIPLIVLAWQRVSRLQGLGLKLSAWPYWVAAILFGLATWPWVFEIVVYAHGWGIRGFDPDKVENIDSLLASWKQVPLWSIVLCLGIVPGICEEIFFRGFLFNGLKRHFNATTTIAISAIAFGLFHIVLSGGAAPERILPSTLMGALLGWLTWRSGSTIPAMILHAVHNSTLLFVVYSRDLLATWNVGQMEQEHLPISWLVISVAILTVAVVLICFLVRTKYDKPIQSDVSLPQTN